MTKFKKGESGNVNGRPKGTADRRTVLRKLLDPHAEDLVTRAVELALDGDMGALRLCLDRCMAPIRAKDDPVDLGKLEGSLAEQAAGVNQAMAEGKITPTECAAILSALASQVRINEATELAERVSILEARNG